MKANDLLSQFGDHRQRVQSAITAVCERRGILLVDDENRENEGDLIFSAQSMTEADMAIMIRHCSGIVCLCITEEKARQLNLPLMVEQNTSKYGTAFTISIEAAEGVTTGVSAADRIQTIRTAIAPNATPESLHHPGAVLCELTNDDGTMARLPEIIEFGLEHKYPVVTINDLKEYQTAPDFLPKLVGSFSCPAAENPTTAIMEAAFRHHYMHYRYINCEVGPENLAAAIQGAKAMGWRGFNCSLPNKVEIIRYLDELGESAKIIGAVNTVVIGDDQRATGENTDGKGFVKAISEIITIQDKKIALLGAGGAARAIAVEMALAGVKEITILNRNRDKGQALADLLNSQTVATARFVLWDHPYRFSTDIDIVINATSAGLYPNVDQRLNIDTDTLLPHMVVADCIPNPVYTQLLRDAVRRGCCHVLPGMKMLVYQAVIAIKYWSGVDVDPDIMLEKLKEVVKPA